MADVSRPLVGALAMTGPAMALLTAFRGMPPKVEHGLWRGFYASWIVIVEVLQAPAPFITILLASTPAGLLHRIVQAMFLDRFLENNPWHAERMKGPRRGVAVRVYSQASPSVWALAPW